MNSFIIKPNLPQGEVTLVAISEEAVKAKSNLNQSGIETISIKRNPYLPNPVASHADLQMLHVNEKLVFTVDEHLCIGESPNKIITKLIKGRIGNKYPNDVLLNCTFLGDKLICNPKTVAPEILEYAENNSLKIIAVNQGYARCSTCIVNENAIITDDKSVFTATQNFLNDVLFISKGSIGLNGYNYGFIGGCSGKLSKNKIAFNGRIESHDDADKIIDFLNKHNIEIVELTDERLYDIGGILPLTEKYEIL